jgi:hypothetical protein
MMELKEALKVMYENDYLYDDQLDGWKAPGYTNLSNELMGELVSNGLADYAVGTDEYGCLTLAAYLNDKGIELFEDMQLKAAPKNKLEQSDIDAIMDASEWEYDTLYGKVTVVSAKLPNGFVLTETSGAIDSKNYNFETGKKIAREQIEHRIWELEGYALAKQLHEVDA